MTTKAKVLLRRFLRGFVAGFASSALTVGVFTGQNLQDLNQWLVLLCIAGVAGAITGLLQSIDKAARWKPEVEN